MKRLLLIPLAALVLTACGVNDGTVYDKEYIAAYDEQYQEPVYRQDCGMKYGFNPATGKYSYFHSCDSVFSHFETRTRHHKACPKIRIRNDEGDTGSMCVSKHRFDKLDVGDYYDKDWD